MEVKKMDSNTRMAFNTVVLYVQLIITVAVNLFSTRLILNAMGVEDYGIVNLIAGIVAMLSFIQNSMAVSSQRYMTVIMGKNDELLLRKIFNTSFVLHVFFVAGLLILLVSVQPLIFNSFIQIPIARIESAKILYYLTLLGTLLVIITVPFDALINAHEDMVAYSAITIIDSLIRLGGAIYLCYYQSDKLIYYGLLIVTIRLVVFILKCFYCRKNYSESRIELKKTNRILMKEMFYFAFWNMFGACAITGRNQGIAIILNTFFGVKINATYGIANQVGGQLSNFTSMIAKAMNPQIMKSAGADNNERVINLTLAQCKITSLMMCLMVIPLLITMPYLLKIWLKNVPEYCVVFCKFFLILNLVTQLSSGLMTAVQSSGRIRRYQITVSMIILLTLPLAYLALQFGYSPQSVLVCMILIEILCVLYRAYYARKIFNFGSILYLKSVVTPVLITFVISSNLSHMVMNMLVNDFDTLIETILGGGLSLLITISITYFVLNKNERGFINSMIKNRLRKS